MRLSRLSLLALTSMLACSSIVLAQADANSRAFLATQAVVRMHEAWDKIASPGASVEAKEVERQDGVVQYNLYVSGLPTDKLYSAVSWPIEQQQPTTMMQGISIGKGGVVMCAGRTSEQCGDASQKDDPIDFTFKPAKGEPYRLALISGQSKAGIVIVPDPITGSDKGCTLTVERLLPHFEIAYFRGSGFAANSDASFEGQSYNEKHLMKTKADGNGSIRFAALPFVAGHKNGTTTVKGVDMSCSPSLSFDWGN